MNRDEDTIFAEALRWHAASEADGMDWDGFTSWLEADARHGEAYDAVALGEALLDEHREHLRAAFPATTNDDEPGPVAPARQAWLRWTGMAIAASLVALLAVPQLLSKPAQTYETATRSRTIALGDGSAIVLAPHSSLEIGGRKQQHIALRGGAWFDIRHDPARALVIETGGVEIADIGTKFDVQEGVGQVRVEVAEGVVRVRSAALDQPIRLNQGRSLAYDAKRGTAIVLPVGPNDIGEWRDGRLTFVSAPLALVAADLSRYAGVTVTVAQGLRNRQFSGTLVIGDGEAAVRDLSQLMGIDLRRDPSGIVLDERR